jgi:adenylylsulfate kinase
MSQTPKEATIEKSTLWLTGRPCAGKSTIAARLKEEMRKRGYRTVHIDGDDVRLKLNADLGFSDKDRKENLRRAAHVMRLFNENGSFVIATFVSPTNGLREMVRGIIASFKLCYVRCGADVCEDRDVKGMYKKARAGQIKEFTGVSAPFEEPLRVDITVDTERNSLEDCVRHILRELHVEK